MLIPWMLKVSFKKVVTTPLLPIRRIQEYAPINGADMDDRMIRILSTPLPLILYMVKKYARGAPRSSVVTVVHRVTFKLFNRVPK